jgi:internalin A
VVYGEVMTEEEVLQVIVQARRENATVLDLSGKQLTSLPATISQLTDLRTLDLRRNRLKRLSEVIGQLPNLQELYLYENQLTSLPESIGRLKHLVILGLSDNQLINLPATIERLQNLKILFLSGNNLTKFPPMIGRLVNLVRLSLSENSLAELPPELGQLVNLQRLDVIANQLTSLPESIGQLTNLRFLHLADNQLTSLPLSIEQLTNLQEINIAGNPLQRVWLPAPKSADRQPPQLQVITPASSTIAAPKSLGLNEAKVILLGQTNTGKTSILKRLVHDQFNLNEAATDGIQIEKWHVDTTTASTGNAQSRDLACFNIWDLGGQDNLHAIHQNFMTERSLYLLVIDNNSSEESNRLEYWLQFITSFAKNSPVLIVGNKSDQAPLDPIYQRYIQRYPNIKGIFAVSCQESSGMKELSHCLLQELATLPQARTPFPANWLAVKTNLENLNKGYISYAEYCQICLQCEVVEESAQQTLIELLHELGVILKFSQHQFLSDTPVLNTAWFMHAIYKIFSDHFLISECKGLLAERMLTRILTPLRSNKREFTYTPAKHRFILDMMIQLGLCSEMTDRRSFLLPELLPKEELPAAAIEQWSGALQFQYRYPIFPQGIISQLLIRCRELIDGQSFWRQGVILKSADNRALIKSDPQSKTISIWVNGSPQTRRDFLTKLRHYFTEIHQAYAAFAVESYVPLPDVPAVTVSYQQLIDSHAEGVEVMVPNGLRQKVNVAQLLSTVDLIDVSQPTPMRPRPLVPAPPTPNAVATNGRSNPPLSVTVAAAISNKTAAKSDHVVSPQPVTIAKNPFVGKENSYPDVTEQQLQEVRGIALRLVKGDLVDSEIDLLSAHLRAPLADAIQHLLGLPAATPEKPEFQAAVIKDPFL